MLAHQFVFGAGAECAASCILSASREPAMIEICLGVGNSSPHSSFPRKANQPLCDPCCTTPVLYSHEIHVTGVICVGGLSLFSSSNSRTRSNFEVSLSPGLKLARSDPSHDLPSLHSKKISKVNLESDDDEMSALSSLLPGVPGITPSLLSLPEYSSCLKIVAPQSSWRWSGLEEMGRGYVWVEEAVQLQTWSCIMVESCRATWLATLLDHRRSRLASNLFSTSIKSTSAPLPNLHSFVILKADDPSTQKI
ncbi:hypothetical protein E2C01_032701 [Portunus trituberculatus]|uniref:Uncharacterized protein n=1 Tax=Portunus trituberculatus TaxID=210409 RepID=A0A5B7F1F3_PORTR|nr:hypothetical protein [Portunus trituberculatus]